MKTVLRILTIVALVAVNIFALAQTSDVPFSFQGYAIDPDGKSLGSTGITVKFTITGPSVTFEEEHALTSDAFGVFHAIIGNSSPTKKLEFSKIDFTSINATTPVYYSLKVEVKKTSGGSYSTISDAPMNAVPYARQAANGVPVGTIIAYAGPTNKIPYGWALCDGSSKDGTSAQWKQLYDIIGTGWGGSGTAYNLPDLRGRFLRGVDGGAGRDDDRASRTASNAGGNTGDNVGTAQGDAFRSHNHGGGTSTSGNHNHGYNCPNCDAGGMDVQWQGTKDAPKNNEYSTWVATGDAGNHSHTINADGGNETRPENAAVYYIIKY